MDRGRHANVSPRVENHPQAERRRLAHHGRASGVVYKKALVFGMQLDAPQVERRRPFQLLLPVGIAGMHAAEGAKPRMLVRLGGEIVDGAGGLGRGGDGQNQAEIDAGAPRGSGQAVQGGVGMGMGFSVQVGVGPGVLRQVGESPGGQLVRESMRMEVDDHGKGSLLRLHRRQERAAKS